MSRPRARYGTGRFFLFHMDFLLVMSRQQAFMLSFLINQQEYLQPNDADAWFECSNSRLDTLVWLEDRQRTRCLNELKSMGFIDFSRRGVPATRWVRILHNNLESACDKAIAESGSLPVFVMQTPQETEINTKNVRTRSGQKVRTRSGQKVRTTIREEYHREENQSSVAGGNATFNGDSIAPIKSAARITREGNERDHDQGNKGFFPELGTKKGKALPFDHYAARLLFAAVCRAAPGKRWRKSAWADQFRLLRADLDGDTDRIEKVLEWLNSPSAKWVRITSAKWFRANFSLVESWSTKSAGLISIPAELSPTAEEVLISIKNLKWPAEVKDQLETFIAHSAAEYERFFAKVQKAIRGDEDFGKAKGIQLRSLIECLWHKLSTPKDFLIQWATDINTLVHNWKGWSGTLKGLSFKVTGKRFTKLACRWMAEYSGQGELWFKVREVLGYEGQED